MYFALVSSRPGVELTVDPEDLGRVIGKRGATAQSLRTLLRALGTKNEARYNLKIVDNGEPRPPREDREYRRDDREQRNEQHAVREDHEDRAEQPRESAAPAPAGAPASTGTVDEDAWSSSATPVVDDTSSSDDDHADAISRARKDLAELDDLDI